MTSLRGAERRSNPDCITVYILDCFASLAMTVPFEFESKKGWRIQITSPRLLGVLPRADRLPAPGQMHRAGAARGMRPKLFRLDVVGGRGGESRLLRHRFPQGAVLRRL